MIFAFQPPGGGILTDIRARAPEQSAVKEWRREYPLDDAKTIHRVAPVFRSPTLALEWLDKILKDRREAAAMGISRTRMKDLGVMAGKSEAFDYHLAGIGVTHQYEGYLTSEGKPLEPFLFRGETTPNYPLIPTLSRCFWDAWLEGNIPRDKARAALHAEELATHRFVHEFFSDPTSTRQFPFLKTVPIEYRAAIARHHGFSTWTLDFTVDPSVAAFFATGSGGMSPPKGTLGVIAILDEAYLREILGDPLITLHPGYESRGWHGVEPELMRRNASVGLEEFGVDRIGPKSFWDLQKAELSEGFFLAHHYAPGIEVERMWHQKWCGVEPMIPIGKLPLWLRLLFKILRQKSTIGEPTLESIINMQVVFHRLSCRIFFEHTGVPFRAPGTKASLQTLLPPNDSFALCVADFCQRAGLAPSAATKALFAAHTTKPS